MTQDKSLQDDLDWFDGLSGKVEIGQGALLRRELAEIERAEADQQDLTHDWQRLQFAMRREKSQSTWNFFAMAASVLIFFSAVYMLKPLGERPMDEAVMRGTTEQTRVSEHAVQDAAQLQAELSQLGVKVVRSSTAQKVTLRIELVYPVAQAVGAILEAHGIPLPEEGDLTVSFMLPAQ